MAVQSRGMRRIRMITNTWTRGGEIFIRENNAERAVIISYLNLDDTHARIKVKGSNDIRNILT